jgi:hypothetical protein
MERMELVVSDNAQGDDLDMLSEELVQFHLERNIIEPHQDNAHQKVVFCPCSAPSMTNPVADLLLVWPIICTLHSLNTVLNVGCSLQILETLLEAVDFQN